MSGAVSSGFPPAPAPDQGAVCSGVVSHIEGENFWLQRDIARVEEIGAMLEDVEVMKSAKDVKEGAAVVASWDGAWYRGLVREVRTDGLLLLHFIDYGNSDQLKRAAIRPAVGAELGDPALALRCRLQTPRPDWEDELAAADFHAELHYTGSEGEVAVMALEAPEQQGPEQPEPVQELADSLASLPLASLLAGEVVGVTGAPPRLAVLFSPALLLPGLDQVEARLAALGSTDLPLLPAARIVQGAPCLAVYAEDGQLYRGRVTGVDGDEVTIRYEDYGNSEVKGPDEVLELPAGLGSPGPATVEVLLARQEGEASQLEGELVGEAELKLEVAGGGRVARLYRGGLELLVRLETVLEADEEPATCPEAVVPRGERVEVTLAAVDSVREVWVTLTSAQPAIDEVQDLLAAAATDLSSLGPPAVGQLAATRFSEDGQLYRVRLEELQDGAATARFIDFGNKEVKDQEELYNLPNSVLGIAMGAFAVEVDTEYEETEENRVKMINILESGDLGLEVEENKGTFFIKEQQVMPVVPAAAKLSEPRGPEAVRVDHVESTAWAWAMPARRQEELDDVMNELAVIRPDLSLAAGTAAGATVAAVFSEDGELYRARVLDMADDGSITVRFIDFGNNEEKAAAELLELPTHLQEAELPGLAERVRLAGGEEARLALEAAVGSEDLSMLINEAGEAEFFKGGERLELAGLVPLVSSPPAVVLPDSETTVPKVGLSTQSRGVVIVEAVEDPATVPGPGMGGDAIRQLKDQLEQDLFAKKESDLRAKEEADQRAKEEADQRAKEEADFKAKEEAIHKAKQEADLKAKQEADLKAEEEAIHKAKQEAAMKAKQEADLQAKQEVDFKAKQEADLKAKQEAAMRAEQEVMKQEKQVTKAEPRMVESRPVFRVSGRPVAVERQPRGPGQGTGFQARPAGGRLGAGVGDVKMEKDKVARFKPSETLTQEMMDQWIARCQRCLAGEEDWPGRPGKRLAAGPAPPATGPSHQTAMAQQAASYFGSTALIKKLRDGEPADVQEIVDWILASDIIQLTSETTSSQVVQVAAAAVASDPARKAALLALLVARLPALASHRTGHLALMAGLGQADALQRRAFQARLEEEQVLLELLRTDSGSMVAQQLLTGEVQPRTVSVLTKLLLPRLVSLARHPPAAQFLLRLVELHLPSGLHRILLELFSETGLSSLVHHATGRGLLEAVLRLGRAGPALLAARWLERNMARVIVCDEAVGVANVVLDILMDEEDGDHKDALDGWLGCLTEGARPLVLEAARHPAGHLLALRLVSLGSSARERVAAVVRRDHEGLVKDPYGVIVIKSM